MATDYSALRRGAVRVALDRADGFEAGPRRRRPRWRTGWSGLRTSRPDVFVDRRRCPAACHRHAFVADPPIAYLSDRQPPSPARRLRSPRAVRRERKSPNRPQPRCAPVPRTPSALQKRNDPRPNRVEIRDFAFPDHERLPAHLEQAGSVFRVPFPVALEFRYPVILPRFRKPSARTGVHVPKTTVNEDRFPSPGKDQVRSAGQVSPVKPVTISHRMRQAANGHLRSRIPASDCAHYPASNVGTLSHRRIPELRSGRTIRRNAPCRDFVSRKETPPASIARPERTSAAGRFASFGSAVDEAGTSATGRRPQAPSRTPPSVFSKLVARRSADPLP